MSIQEFPKLTGRDRVLILASHPDDEAIATGGILQEAVRLKIPLKVVYFTSGELNELSFLVYKKRPVLSRRELLRMGAHRLEEAIASMHSLGVKKEDLAFLGYPDAGTINLFTRCWGKGTPFRHWLTRVGSVPYDSCVSCGAPYVGESVVADLKKVYGKFKPTRLFLPHPIDANPDHRAAYLFSQIALWDLRKELSAVQTYFYLIHYMNWPRPRGFFPQRTLDVPPSLLPTDLIWYSSPLSEAQIERKKQAIHMFKTQIGYNPRYLPSFARKNELFSQFPEIVLKDEGKGEIDWKRLEGRERITTQMFDTSMPKQVKLVKSVTYALQSGTLLVKIKSRRWINKIFGLNIYLFGYRLQTDFSKMPKMLAHLGRAGRVRFYDQRKIVRIKDAKIQYKNGELILQIPLHHLGDPEYVLCCVRDRIIDWPVEATAWRVLKVES